LTGRKRLAVDSNVHKIAIFSDELENVKQLNFSLQKFESDNIEFEKSVLIYIIVYSAVYNAQTFLSADDNVKSSVITEKANTTKFEILLTFDLSLDIYILILSVLGFTRYMMYRISSLSRLIYAPGIFPGILSK
jgi:uncharacterized Tic20 family protein